VTSREAQRRMRLIEEHDQDFTTLDFMRWALKLDDDPEDVFREEIERAALLADNYYARVSEGLTILSPHGIIMVGFQQGLTLAAGALGRPTFQEESQ
jgi:hypothetical protein